MKFLKLSGSVIFFLVFGFLSCKKQTEVNQDPKISDYLPLQAGKYITYRTDSTVFTNFGRNTEIHSYQEKQVVDALITDGLDRPSYRIFRYLNDSTASGPWVSAGTFFITPTANTAEVIEDNLRVVKLALPISSDNIWNGNRFLPDEPYSTQYVFSNDNNMNSSTLPFWNYSYSNLDTTMILNNQTVNNILIVNGINEANNLGDPDPSIYQSVNYVQDMYAKGIGLVNQNFIMWEYQPNPGGPSGGFKVGFGVKRTMINHN